jgi:Icc-related predicted phosphoesterase
MLDIGDRRRPSLDHAHSRAPRDSIRMTLRILAVTDEVDQRIYSPTVKDRMGDVDLVLGCGDLPASYLEFLSDALMRPVYYVLGNHAEELTRAGERGVPKHPEGCIDLGGKVVRDRGSGLIMAGLPGSIRYSEHEPVQYTEWQMAWMILKMAPRLLWNQVRHGRALDILVTHSPPRHVNDRDDFAHRGFKVMRRFLRWFRPRYQVHGHIHLYDRSQPNIVRFIDTDVINVFPYQRLDLTFDALCEQADAAADAPVALDPAAPEVEHQP